MVMTQQQYNNKGNCNDRVTGGGDDEGNSYDGKFNPNFIIIQLQLHSFIYFLFFFFLLPIKRYSGKDNKLEYYRIHGDRIDDLT